MIPSTTIQQRSRKKIKIGIGILILLLGIGAIPMRPEGIGGTTEAMITAIAYMTVGILIMLGTGKIKKIIKVKKN